MENQPPRYNNGNNYYGQGGYNPWEANDLFATSPVSGKSRGVTALLAILLGTLGIHYFYLNKTTAGIVFLLISILSCGALGVVTAILSIVSGVKLLCTTNVLFDKDYALSPSNFPI